MKLLDYGNQNTCFIDYSFEFQNIYIPIHTARDTSNHTYASCSKGPFNYYQEGVNQVWHFVTGEGVAQVLRLK